MVMETQYTTTTAGDYPGNIAANQASNPSAVAWGAIFAGAAAAAALSLILLLLGTGFGLQTVSPWSHEGISATTWSVTTIAWVTFTSLVASAVGGYIAGRLRTRWLATHSDEIYFRDTAHGFLAWAIATLATATLLTSVIASIVGMGAKVGESIATGAATATVAAGAAAAAGTTASTKAASDDLDNKPLPYFLDMLFRKVATATPTNANALSTAPTPTAPTPTASTSISTSIDTARPPQPGTGSSKAEVARIYVNAISTGTLPVEDIKYAGQVVAQATGLNQSDAENRVVDTFKLLQTKLREAEVAAKDAADKARKASSYGSLWLFISLLAGAFIASLSAIHGGRQRDL
jgi:hypothetical protein